MHFSSSFLIISMIIFLLNNIILALFLSCGCWQSVHILLFFQSAYILSKKSVQSTISYLLSFTTRDIFNSQLFLGPFSQLLVHFRLSFFETRYYYSEIYWTPNRYVTMHDNLFRGEKKEGCNCKSLLVELSPFSSRNIL